MSTRFPLFPLNTVLFPGGRLSLRIFERRYLDMVRQCLRDNTGFVVVGIAEGAEVGGRTQPHGVGVRVRIIDWNTQPDGLLGLVVEADERVRIVEWWTAADGLLVGRVQPTGERAPQPVVARQRDLAELLDRLLDRFGELYVVEERRLDDSAWVAGRLAELLPLPNPLKQNLLEMDDSDDRLALIREGLRQLGLGPGGSTSRQ